MHWMLGALVANGAIFIVEHINRAGGYGGFQHILRIALPIIVAQYGLYVCWKGAPSLMLAWVVFTVGNTLFRIVNAYWLGEPPNVITWCGIGLAVAAAFTIKCGAGR